MHLCDEQRAIEQTGPRGNEDGGRRQVFDRNYLSASRFSARRAGIRGRGSPFGRLPRRRPSPPCLRALVGSLVVQYSRVAVAA